MFSTRAEFWRDREAWPRDTPEMVFLGRAVHELGKAFFGDEWTGEEPHLELISFIRIAIKERELNNFIAKHLPQFARKEYHGSMAPPPTGHDDHRPKFAFSKDEWQALKNYLDRHNERVLLAKARLKKVQSAIAEYAVAQKLGTSFFTISGRAFVPIDPNWWITPQLDQRFASCSINAGMAAWIFVSRAGLEAMLREASPPATTNDARKCAIWLEEQFRADPDRRVSKSAFADQAKQNFGVGPKPFGRIWDELVTRYPERKKAGPKRKQQLIR